MTPADAVNVRATPQYIATSSSPDIAGPAQLLIASFMQTESNAANHCALRRLKNLIKYSKLTKNDGLKFVGLDKSSCRMVLFTDAPFGKIVDESSRIGIIFVMADGKNRAHLLYWGSKKCRRVAQSVVAAEMLALVTELDQVYVVKNLLDELFGAEFH